MHSPDPGISVRRLSSHFPVPIPYLLLTFAHILLIWMLTWFPTQDGPSHVYNVHILADLMDGGRIWGKYYEEHLSFVPNLGFTLVTLPLLKMISPLVAERIFLTLYVILLVTAVPVFSKTYCDNAFPGSYIVFPVIFNFTLLMGFYSYAIAVPLFLLALAVSWRMRDSSWWLKTLAYNVMAFVIFICHFIPFAFYLMGIILIPFSNSKNHKEIIKGILTLIPSLGLAGWYLSKGQGGVLSGYELLPAIVRIPTLLTELLSFSTLSFSRLQLITSALVMGYVLFAFHGRSKRKAAHVGNGERLLLMLSCVLCIIYLFAPFRLGEGSYFNERFPWVILLVISPLLLGQTIFSRLLTVTACISLVINWFIFSEESKKVEVFVSGLEAGCGPGDYIMTYRHLPVATMPRIDVIRHAASYYGIVRGCIDIGNYETTYPYFYIRYKSNDEVLLPPVESVEYSPNNINFSRHPSISYVLAVGDAYLSNNTLADNTTTMFKYNDFKILKIRDCN